MTLIRKIIKKLQGQKCQICGKKDNSASNGLCKDCRRKAYIKNQIKNFNEKLLTIPHAPIVFSGEKSPKLKVSDMPELIFSNITKSNFEKIGDFVIVDTETTGISKRCSIIEVSALRCRNFEPVELFTTFVNPQKEIPIEITNLTGITSEMLSNSPEFYQISQSLLEFIGNDAVVGHNLKFDVEFLFVNNANLFKQKRKYFDTLTFAKKVLKAPKYKYVDGNYKKDYESDWDVDDYKLDTLCEYYDIYRDNAHRSASDCLATGLLFKALIDDKFG